MPRVADSKKEIIEEHLLAIIPLLNDHSIRTMTGELYVSDGNMAVCLHCRKIVSYRKGTILHTNNRYLSPRRVHVCGRRPVRTSWKRMDKWLQERTSETQRRLKYPRQN